MNVGSNPIGVAVKKVYLRIDTTTALTFSANIFKFRQSVALTATVGATPKGKETPLGTVTFFDGTTSIGNGTVSSGQASLTTSSLSVGLHSITAKYSGDDKFKPSTSSAQELKVSNPILLIIVVIFLIGGGLWFIATQRKKGTDSRNKRLRDLEPPVQTIPYSANIQKWAIIVGISKYKDESLNLKYADRDAEKVYKLLRAPAGGGFEEDHIKKLINEEATTSGITKALHSFLKKASKDDIVMLYFACHGSPDPERPNNIYLLTHDTDPIDIAGTALPMREIDLSLRENVNAERVVIIADACHSAAICSGVGRRGAGNSAQAINAYLQEVSKAKGDVALLTSAEATESSQEGEQWGGGHGVFTHFLLQGMQGDADGYGQQKDGIVTVGELFDYVRENVIKATNYTQHPAIGPNTFDRSLPISISSSDQTFDAVKT